MRRILLTVIFGCNLCLAEAGYFNIIADIANVRVEPSSSASLTGRLRIGNSFVYSRSKDDWLCIDTAFVGQNTRNNYALDIQGWIHRSSCIQATVDTPFLDMNLTKATSLKDSIVWLERRAAFTPGNVSILNILHQKYSASGDSVKIKAIEKKIRGTDPAFIASEYDSIITLLGIIDSSGNFQSLQWIEYPDFNDISEFKAGKKAKWRCLDKENEEIKRRAMNVRATLGGLIWYKLGIDHYMEETLQFAVPVIVPSDATKNDPQSTVYQNLANTDGSIVCSIKLGKGKFSFPPYTFNIIATKRLFPVKYEGSKKGKKCPISDEMTEQLVGSAFNETGILLSYSGYLTEYNCRDVLVGGWTNDMYGTPYMHMQRGIIDQKEICVWPPNSTKSERWITNEGSFLEMNSFWFRFGPDASFPAYTIIPFASHLRRCENCNGNEGLSLIRITKSQVKTFTIISHYHGD